MPALLRIPVTWLFKRKYWSMAIFFLLTSSCLSCGPGGTDIAMVGHRESQGRGRYTVIWGLKTTEIIRILPTSCRVPRPQASLCSISVIHFAVRSSHRHHLICLFLYFLSVPEAWDVFSGLSYCRLSWMAPGIPTSSCKDGQSEMNFPLNSQKKSCLSDFTAKASAQRTRWFREK